MRLKTLALCLMTSLLCPPGFAAEVIRLAVSTSWNMPYAKFDNERLTGGIIFDLAQSMEKSLGMPVVFVPLPRKRIDGAALAGDYDLRCYVTPQWTEIPDKFVWSAKLFDLTDVVFGGEIAPDPKDLAGLNKGAVISAVLGYGYPTLDPLFASGQLKREDAVGQENVMLKMTAARTPYGVSDSLVLSWYQRTTPQHRLSKWRLGISRHDFQCAIPKNGNVQPGKLLKSLDDIKRSGRVEQILQSYR
jgi:polar amino acid transport system substrate-binding protein